MSWTDAYAFESEMGIVTIAFGHGAGEVWVVDTVYNLKLHVKCTAMRAFELFNFYSQYSEPKRV